MTLVPAWHTVPDLAQAFHLSVPAYLAWCEHGEGTWWTARLRQAKALEWECLQEALRRPPPAPLPPGYALQGGPCNLEDSGIYPDAEEAA